MANSKTQKKKKDLTQTNEQQNPCFIKKDRETGTYKATAHVNVPPLDSKLIGTYYHQ